VVKLIARPIDQWPGELTARRHPTEFTSSWTDTVHLLAREVEHLAVRRAEVVLQVAITERDCRLDGWIRADARPAHPGVILSFESKHGPLRYHTDRFENRGWGGYLPGWQSNVRAIALGLEALRRVDRYGIAQAGEQYRGWNALPPATPMDGPLTFDAAVAFIGLWAWDMPDVDSQEVVDDLAGAYRLASKRLHPDVDGGDPALFRRLTDARDLIRQAAPA
jgi:hypothetical protein